MRSIIPGNKKEQCFICRKYCHTEEHHIFGAANRNLSEANGLKVNLCVDHHKGTWGCHGKNGQQVMQYLHEIGQEAYEDQKMKYKGMTMAQARAEFLREFGKNYL